MRLEIAVQINRLEYRPVLRSTSFRIEHSVERIQIRQAGLRRRIVALIGKRQIKLRLRKRRASAKRRLSPELCQHQLFDWVIEKSPARANAGPPRTTRTPRDTDSRRKCLVISRGHSRRNARIARNHQPNRILRRAIRIRTSAGVHRRRLPRTESLDVLELIR